jgi:uncharacterized protein YgbK (DUF1537 family)
MRSFAEQVMSVDAAFAVDNPVSAAVAAIDRARATIGDPFTVLVTSAENSKRIPVDHAALVADDIAEIAARTDADTSFDAFVLTGGDTAIRVARRLSAGMALREEFAPGVPICSFVGAWQAQDLPKADGFGGEAMLVHDCRFFRREHKFRSVE